MMNAKATIIIFLFPVFVLLSAGLASAGITITTDYRPVAFGVMSLDEEKELALQGVYHNQVTCSSTNGNLWYLKINLLQPLTSGVETIPLENFKWQLAWTNGQGTQAYPYQFRQFALFPDMVYRSAANEAAGSSIEFQFKYYLKISPPQVAGAYSTTIRFTMTEVY